MSKKILIFSLAYYPKHIGGAEVAIKEITDRIDPGEIQFHMVTNRFDSTLPRIEQVGNIKVHRIGIAKKNPSMADLRKFPLHLNKFIFQFLAAYQAIKLHKKYQYDGIWAMMAHSCGVPAVIFKTFYPKARFFLTLQEGDPIDYIEKKMRPFWPFFSHAFIKADAIHAISTFLGNWARARGFKGTLKIIPNAVNTKHFSQSYPEAELAELKNKLGRKPEDKYLITTSRLVKKNAIDDVIEALQYLSENIKFFILGAGPLENNLKFKIKNLKLDNRVIFLGHVDHKELPRYLKISDIFIRPSLSEGMGNSFIEAMAAGLPVIATQEGGIADFLFDQNKNPEKIPTGWAVAPRDPKGIAKQVENILANREKTVQIITNAKKLVFEKYDWEKIAPQMKEIFLSKFYGAN